MKPIKRLLWGSVLFVFLSPSFVLGATLSELRTGVRRHVRDNTSVTGIRKYSDAMIDSLLNEAQAQTINASWAIEKTSGIALATRTTFYAFPSDYIAIREFDFQETTTGRTRQLEEKSERVLRQENPDWARSAGAPIYYLTRLSTSGATTVEFGVTPVPSTSTQLGTALIKYYATADDMSADADVPFNGLAHLYSWHHILQHYAVAQLKMYEGDTNGSAAYMQFFSAEVQNMVNRLGMRENYFPSFGGVSNTSR